MSSSDGRSTTKFQVTRRKFQLHSSLGSLAESTSMNSLEDAFDSHTSAYSSHTSNTQKEAMNGEESHVDPSMSLTNRLLATAPSMADVAKQGNEGDIPLPPGFARRPEFWLTASALSVMALFIAFIAAMMLNTIRKLSRNWIDCDLSVDSNCAGLHGSGSGNKDGWWGSMTVCMGLLIGILESFGSRYLPVNRLPVLGQNGFDHAMVISPKYTAYAVILISLSIIGGSGLGPELALLLFSGGLGRLLTQFVEFKGEGYGELVRLGTMCCAIVTIIPSPALAALLIHEAAEPPRTFMESSVLLSLSACLAFIVFALFLPFTSLDQLDDRAVLLAFKWASSEGYQTWQLGSAVLIGLCSALVATVLLLWSAFLRVTLRFVKSKVFPEYHSLHALWPPVLGGAFLAVAYSIAPGAIYNGRDVALYVSREAQANTLSTHTMLTTAIVKLVLLGMTSNFGWIGGQSLPLCSVGMLLGGVVFNEYTDIPLAMAMGCFAVSLPCTILPLPFTFTMLGTMSMFLGLSFTAPLFVSAIVAHLFVSSFGITAALSPLPVRKRQHVRWWQRILYGSTTEVVTAEDEGEFRSEIPRVSSYGMALSNGAPHKFDSYASLDQLDDEANIADEAESLFAEFAGAPTADDL